MVSLSRFTLSKLKRERPPLMDEELQPHIFPTQSKSKHSKYVSYPVGAVNLSRALDGVPQHAALCCIFTAGNPHRDVGKKKFRVMHVLYRKRERSFYDGDDAESRGVFEPKWEIWVYDVRAEERYDIKKALMDVGLSLMLKPWLIANAEVTGQSGEAAFMLDYDVEKRVLVPSQGNKIAPQKIR
jgi:hypothetical protein